MFQINHNHTVVVSGTVKVDIQFKALDRFLDYLEANEQKQVDKLTDSVNSATGKLVNARTKLNQAVTNSQ